MNKKIQKKIDILNDKAFKGLYKDINQAEEWTKESIQLSREEQYTIGTAWALMNSGLISIEKGHLETALQNLKQANRIFLELNQSDSGKAASFNSLGLCYIRMGKMKDAFSHLKESLKICSGAELKHLECTALNYLGILHFKSEKYSQALRFFQKSRKLTASEFATSILNNLGCTYRALGENGQALIYLNNALLHAEGEGRKESQVAILEEIALVFGQMGVYEKGISTIHQALDKCSGYSSRLKTGLYIHLGEQYIQMDNFDAAEEALLKAAEQTNDNNAVEHRKLFLLLSKVSENRSDFKEALEFYQRFYQLSDSIKSSELEEEVWMMETEHLQQINRRITAVGEMGKKLTVCLDRDAVYQTLLSSLADLFKMDFCVIGEVSENGDSISASIIHSKEGFTISRKIEKSLKGPPRGAAEWVVRHQTGLLVHDYEKEIGNFLNEDDKEDYPDDPGSVLCLPFHTDTVRGVIGVYSRELYSYNDEDWEFLEMLSSYAAIALSNSGYTRKILDYNTELVRLNRFDSLTGIFNRRQVIHILEQSWKTSCRNSQFLHVLVIDVDHFKVINDTFGHDAGDACLMHMGQVFRELLNRSQDGYGRYGGEEFLVFMQDMSPDEAQEMADRLRQQIYNTPVRYNEMEIPLSVSIGMCSIIPPRKAGSEGIYSIIKTADTNMYVSKSQGRNRMTATIVSE